MTEEDAFLHAIAEAPTDDTHRLVYADWLEERGDPRAEWLRLQQALQCPITWEERPGGRPFLDIYSRSLAAQVPDRRRYIDNCAREQELLRTLDLVWLHAV